MSAHKRPLHHTTTTLTLTDCSNKTGE